MPNRPTSDVPICPDCRSKLRFVASWPCRGRWGYHEVRTYECPVHGPVFVGPETSVGPGHLELPAKAPDDGDGDALVPAPRKPTPTLGADAIAVREPDSD